MLARGDLAIEADIDSDTAAVSGMVEHLWRPRRRPGGCATPPAAASARSANELAQETGLGVVLDERRCRSRPMVARRLRDARHRPALRGQRGQVPRRRRARGGRRRRSPRCARTRWAHDAVDIGEIADEPAATVVLRTAFGGTRIVDMLVGDPLPADLLRKRVGRHVPGDSGADRRDHRRRQLPGQGGRQRRAAARSACELLEQDLPEPDEWVLVHVGFAMAKIDEKEALLTLAAVQKLGTRLHRRDGSVRLVGDHLSGDTA